MNRYSVNIERTEYFTIEVLAKDEEQAISRANTIYENCDLDFDYADSHTESVLLDEENVSDEDIENWKQEKSIFASFEHNGDNEE